MYNLECARVLAGAAATVAGGSIRFLTLLAKQTLRGSEMTQREREREREEGRERGEKEEKEVGTKLESSIDRFLPLNEPYKIRSHHVNKEIHAAFIAYYLR
jgi:hypothetical protein